MSEEFSENTTLLKSNQEMGKWHYCYLPGIYKDLAEGHTNRGMIPVIARIGNTTWKTSLLPVTKTSNYIIAIKADVRKAENLNDGDKLTIYFKFAI